MVRQQPKPPKAVNVARLGVQVGPSASKPGSRLKGDGKKTKGGYRGADGHE